MRSKRRSMMWLSGLAALLGFGGMACGWFEDPTPEQVRISLTGESGKEVEVIVSQNFGAGVTEEGTTIVTIFASDTLVRMLPFDTTFRLGSGRDELEAKRFFFQAKRVDEDLTTFTARAYLDSSLRYEQTGILTLSPYRWAYAFNQVIGEILEVI